MLYVLPSKDMKRSHFRVALVAVLVLISPSPVALAHTLFGDFKVDERWVVGLKPQVFHVGLCGTAGNLISRQPITNNGRYRFLNVRNGEYDLVVELEGQEVARVHIMISESVTTDIRRDLFLEWRDDSPTQEGRKAQTLSVTDFYRRSPPNATRFSKAQERIAKRDYTQAIATLDEMVRADSKDFEAWTELGTVHFQLGHMAEAGKAYARALQERPSFFPAMLNLGKLRVAEKNYDGAIETLTQVVQVHSESADANYFLGETYLQVKKGSKAVGYLNEALRLDPVGKADAHLRLAALYHGAGMKDRAAAEYELFLVKKPDYSDRQKLLRYISENKKP